MVGLPGFEPGTSCTPNSSGKIAQAVHFQVFIGHEDTSRPVELCRRSWLFVALAHYIIIYSTDLLPFHLQTACYY